MTATPKLLEEDEQSTRLPTPRRMAWRRFAQNRLAIVGLAVVAAMALTVVIAPLFYTTDPNAVHPELYRLPPAGSHPLGTDSSGRDVLARLFEGGRISLLVGLTAALAGTVLGLILGLVSGYFGRWIDGLMSRLTDVVLTIPSLIVLIVIAAFVGPSLVTLIVLIAFFEWPSTFRIVRGMTLSLKEQDAIQAIDGLGAGSARIIRRHLLPRVVGPLTITTTLLVVSAIMTAATLSFLGLGVPPPTASWGNMLTEAQSLTILESMPWLWLPPGAAIAVTAMAVNFIGDGLRDAFDPRTDR